MKEGKLSSALQKMKEEDEKNAVGKVLWHSLNENGEIGVYDMKFGDTIIRNLTESDIEQTLVNEHMHAKQDEDDKERPNK
jgi:hypothetical protein